MRASLNVSVWVVKSSIYYCLYYINIISVINLIQCITSSVFILSYCIIWYCNMSTNNLYLYASIHTSIIYIHIIMAAKYGIYIIIISLWGYYSHLMLPLMCRCETTHFTRHNSMTFSIGQLKPKWLKKYRVCFIDIFWYNVRFYEKRRVIVVLCWCILILVF